MKKVRGLFFLMMASMSVVSSSAMADECGTGSTSGCSVTVHQATKGSIDTENIPYVAAYDGPTTPTLQLGLSGPGGKPGGPSGKQGGDVVEDPCAEERDHVAEAYEQWFDSSVASDNAYSSFKISPSSTAVARLNGATKAMSSARAHYRDAQQTLADCLEANGLTS